MPKSKK
jgi:hypothetical protein